MLNIDLTTAQLELLATMEKETGRLPEEIARRALLDALEDYEDGKLAAERMRTSDGTRYSLEDIMAHYAGEAQDKRRDR